MSMTNRQDPLWPSSHLAAPEHQAPTTSPVALTTSSDGRPRRSSSKPTYLLQSGNIPTWAKRSSTKCFPFLNPFIKTHKAISPLLNCSENTAERPLDCKTETCPLLVMLPTSKPAATALASVNVLKELNVCCLWCPSSLQISLDH